jgi:hypothetical protein
MWWLLTIIPALTTQRQEDCKFKTSVPYIERKKERKEQIFPVSSWTMRSSF